MITLSVNESLMDVATEEDVVLKHESGLINAFTKYGNEIFEWCANNNIKVELLGKWTYYESGAPTDNYVARGRSMWKIKDPQHRMIFILRWQK